MTTEVLTEPTRARSCWRGVDLQDSTEWIVELTPSQVQELEAATKPWVDQGIPPERLGPQDLPLPSLQPLIADWVEELENGRGFILVRGLPVQNYSERQASLAYWAIGSHMGIPVSQNAAGHLLGHVRDTGKSYEDPSVRGYQTNMYLPFHTDSSDLVGLLCLRGAKSGGLSAIVSSGAVYNEVLRRRPDLVELMYEPFYYDRREEQSEGELPYFPSSLYAYRDGKLSMRYVRHFIDSAQRFDEVPRLTDKQVELLDLIDEIASSDGFPLLMDFQPGDMQFLNNYTIMHSRTGYEDHQAPALKRHLLRLWLTLPEGTRRRLPADFGRAFGGEGQANGGRGGVTPKKPS